MRLLTRLFYSPFCSLTVHDALCILVMILVEGGPEFGSMFGLSTTSSAMDRVGAAAGLGVKVANKACVCVWVWNATGYDPRAPKLPAEF